MTSETVSEGRRTKNRTHSHFVDFFHSLLKPRVIDPPRKEIEQFHEKTRRFYENRESLHPWMSIAYSPEEWAAAVRDQNISAAGFLPYDPHVALWKGTLPQVVTDPKERGGSCVNKLHSLRSAVVDAVSERVKAGVKIYIPKNWKEAVEFVPRARKDAENNGYDYRLVRNHFAETRVMFEAIANHFHIFETSFPDYRVISGPGILNGLTEYAFHIDSDITKNPEEDEELITVMIPIGESKSPVFALDGNGREIRKYKDGTWVWLRGGSNGKWHSGPAQRDWSKRAAFQYRLVPHKNYTDQRA